jgi:hypothetical protein
MPEEKSHVGMGFHVCPVCLREHDEVVLLDRRLRKSLTRHEFVGWKMCEEHQRLKDEGYIALVCCENQPSSLQDAKRTGDLAHVKAEAWDKIFINLPVPESGMAFIDQEVFRKIQDMAKHQEPANEG